MEVSTNIKSEWFTNEFLENVLKAAENDATLKITKTDVEDAAEKGAHYGSTMFRITMDITRGSSTSERKSIIIKLLPKQMLGDIMAESTAFPREIEMFSDILPKLHALLENVVPGLQKEFGAKHYYSENKMPFVMMLEDLSVSGFKLADRTVGLDLPHSILVMKTLARFHASSAVLHEQQPVLFDIFSKSLFLESKKMSDFITGFSFNGVKRAINVIEKWQEYGQKFSEMLTNRLDTLIEDFKSAYTCYPKDFNVLIHGDFWINNMMFSYDDISGDVSEIKLVDYQLCSLASPTVDLQYFFYTSIRDDIREHNIQDLLKVYHDELVKTLTLLDYKKKIIEFEDLLEAYEKKAVVGLLWSLVGLPVMMGERGIKHDFDNMANKDTPTEIPISDACERVWQRLLPIFIKKGLL